MNDVKKQKRYVLGGSIFVLLLLVCFAVNTVMFNNKMNHIVQQYMADSNQQLAEHISSLLKSGEEFVADFADTLTRMPEFLLTEELLKRKADAIGFENIAVVSVNEKNEISFSPEEEELREWLGDNEEAATEPRASFLGKKQIIFSAPVVKEKKTEKIVLGLQSYREIHSLIKQTDNWRHGIRVLINRTDGEILMMEKGEDSFVSEEEIPGILEKVRQSGYKEMSKFGNRFISVAQVEGTDWVQISMMSQNVLKGKMGKYTGTYFVLILGEFLVLTAALYAFQRDMKKKEVLFLKDSLTGGYNREGFLRMSQECIGESNDTDYTVVCLNICDFRHINELWGEDTGNKALKFVCRVLEEKAGKKELVCRNSMDHFFLLLREETEERVSARAAEMIDTINEKIHEKFSGYNMEFYIGACRLSVEENIEKAMGKAIYASKQGEERNVCRFYDEEAAEKIKEEQEINALFAESLENHDFKIYFQPKVSGDKPCQAEALVRWVHKERGVIYPDQFIPLFEHNGKICELDLYVFEEVCRIESDWLKQGKEAMEISVNISRFTLLNAGTEIWEKYRSVKEKYNIPDNLIEIELTENILMDESQIAYMQKLLQGFCSCGLKVALDDFGFAYSSLSLLKAFDIDTIKLDRRFFIDENEKSKKIVKYIIQLAHGLNMRVVAEGIEEDGQIEVLQEIGCDFIQGYVYSKPLSLEKFNIWKQEYEEQKSPG